MKKVLIAMSGGVDSSVAAAKIVEQGYDAVGIHLSLVNNNNFNLNNKNKKGCCSFKDSKDAKRICDILNIPYYVWDFSKIFKEKVINNYIDEYNNGRTPHPCIRCNEYVKFSSLLNKALLLGFDYLCTGHYALIIYDKLGQPQLHKANNLQKDQSYVLSTLNKNQLKHLIFPLGSMSSKSIVRQEAKKLGFLTYKKTESYDLCFISKNTKRDWLKKNNMLKKGLIVNKKNQILGSHNGVANFTIGQRKGLNIKYNQKCNSKPKFVLNINSKQNTIIVGSKEDMKINIIHASYFLPCGEPLDLIKDFLTLTSLNNNTKLVSKKFSCDLQFRSHGQIIPSLCFLTWNIDEKEIYHLTAYLKHVVTNGINAGQSLVLYKQTRVIGRAMINKTNYHKI